MQKFVVNALLSTWRSVANVELLQSVLGPLLISIVTRSQFSWCAFCSQATFSATWAGWTNGLTWTLLNWVRTKTRCQPRDRGAPAMGQVWDWQAGSRPAGRTLDIGASGSKAPWAVSTEPRPVSAEDVYSPQFSTHYTIFIVPHPFLAYLLQQRYWQTGVSFAEGCQDRL